jgi:uncharacterized repeat protein (TIGR01451 family)
MTKRWLVPILLLTTAVSSGKASGPEPLSKKTEKRPGVTTVNTPLFFEENHGQTDARVKFLSRGGNYALALTAGEAIVAVGAKSPALLRMRFEGANPNVALSGVDRLPGKIYYADVTKKGPLTPNQMFERVEYSGVYSGIDLVYYGNNRELEFDFVVAPHADPKQIRLSLDGADKVSIDRNGELSMRTGDRDVRLKRPVIYQERDGARQEIRGGYRLSGKKNQFVSFKLDRYDPSLPLVIDPVWSFGSTADDYLVGLEVDSAGNPHVLSTTLDPDTLAVSTATIPGVLPPPNCVVSKLDPATTPGGYSYVLVFKNMIACDAFTLSPNDVSYVAGFSLLNNRATTIASINESTGTPVVSYFTVGNYDSSAIGEGIQAMAANSAEELFLIGACREVGPGEPGLDLSGYNETPNPANGSNAEACTIPQTAGLSTSQQPILSKLAADGTLLYASFLAPGVIETRPYGLAADAAGRAYIVGNNAPMMVPTDSTFDPECTTHLCLYLMQLDTTTTGPASLLYSRFLWRVDNAEEVLVRLGPTGEVYVAADGDVTDNFPNNRPTNPYPWSFTRFPDTKQGLQLARLDLDPATGIPTTFNFAFIFNAWTALQGPFRDHLTDLRVLPSGAATVASITYEVGPSSTITRGNLETFYRSGELLAQRSEYILDPRSGGGDKLLIAADGTGMLYAAFQRLRGGTGPDLDLQVEQVGSPDPGANTPPAFSANDVTVVMSSYFDSGAFVNGFSYFYYDAEDGLTPASGGCDRTLGSFFILGSTAVTCSFTDSGGLSVTGTFQVNVTQPPYPGAPFVGNSSRPPDSTYNGLVFFYTPATITAEGAEPDARAFLTTRLNQQPPIPPNLQAGSPPMYFELSATGAAGPYTVCIDTSGMSFPKPSTIRLYHFEGPPTSAWVDITSSGGPSGGEVCGNSGLTLGTFAIFYAQIPETAISTIAGNGVRGYSIDGPGGDPADDFVAGPATSTPLGYLFGGAYDRTRNLLYFSDGNFIMRLNLTTNVVTQVAGNGVIQIGMIDGPGGDPRDDYVEGGHPFNTYVGFPWEMVVDPAGDLVFFDRNSCRLRRLDMAQNQLFSVAGNGTCGNTGDDFNALSASIAVSNLAYDAAGNLFFADGSNMVVRRIDRATNMITTVAGDGTSGIPVDGSPLATLTPAQALAFDRQGHLIVGAGMDLVRISPGADGLVNGSADETMTVLAGCHTNCGAPFGGDGLPITDPKVFVGTVWHLLVADDGAIILSDNNRVRRIAPGADGVVTKASDEVIQTVGGYYDSLNLNTNYNGDTFATQSLISTYVTLAQDAQGRLLIVDTNNFRVRRFGMVTTGSPSSADIQVSAQDTPDPIQTGARLDYTVRIENFGPATATGVALTYMVPSGAEFHSVGGSPAPSCTTPSVGGTGTVTCNLGSLANGGIRDLTISVTPRTGGTLAAQFTVTTTAPDANPTNNTWSLTTTVSIAPAVITIVENIIVTDAPVVLPSAMLTINETIHVDDTPQVLPSAMLTINETITVTDAPTAGILDTAPPILSVPGNMNVAATEPTGATVSYFAQAYDVIDGPVPVVCTPPPGSLFPLNATTTVTCTASDAAGNVSTGTFTVTVIMGVPNMTIRILGQGRDPSGLFYLDLEFRNSGTGFTPLVNLQALILRTLTGTGNVTYSPGGITPFPNQMAAPWAPGAAGYGRLYLNVPSTVRRFSITINGNLVDVLGTVRSFSFAQAVIP